MSRNMEKNIEQLNMVTAFNKFVGCNVFKWFWDELKYKII